MRNPHGVYTVRNCHARNIFFSMTQVVHDAHIGCYIAVPVDNFEGDALKYPEWTFGGTRNGRLPENTPDIAIDPDDGRITLMNTSVTAKTYFVTVSNSSRVVTSTGAEFALVRGLRDDYVTFIALVYPGFSVGLCRLVPGVGSKKKRLSQSELARVQVSSDVQDFVQTPVSSDSFEIDVFPLAAGSPSTSYLCTQSAGGALTHFAHPSTFYAVDFRCAIGTPIVAIFDGEVVEIRNDSTNSGVRVEDLFTWNSILIKSAGNSNVVFCEYVHVKKDSFKVSIGQRIHKGEILCESGVAGFCPEPHLHLEIHRDSIAGSPSVPMKWKGAPFEAGLSYP